MKLKTDEEIINEFENLPYNGRGYTPDHILKSFILSTLHERDAAIRKMIEGIKQKEADSCKDHYCRGRCVTKRVRLIDSILSLLPVENKNNEQDK